MHLLVIVAIAISCIVGMVLYSIYSAYREDYYDNLDPVEPGDDDRKTHSGLMREEAGLDVGTRALVALRARPEGRRGISGFSDAELDRILGEKGVDWREIHIARLENEIASLRRDQKAERERAEFFSKYQDPVKHEA